MAAQAHIQETVLKVNNLRCIYSRDNSSTTNIPTLLCHLTRDTISKSAACLAELTIAILCGYYEVLDYHTGKTTPPNFDDISRRYFQHRVTHLNNRYLDKRHCPVPNVIDASDSGSSGFNLMYADPTRYTFDPATQPTEKQKPALLDFVKSAVAQLHQSEVIHHIMDVRDISITNMYINDYLCNYQHMLLYYSKFSAALPCHIVVVIRGRATQESQVHEFMRGVGVFTRRPDEHIPMKRTHWGDSTIPDAVSINDRFHYIFKTV